MNQDNLWVESEILVTSGLKLVAHLFLCLLFYSCLEQKVTHYTGCPRRNVPDFGRVFLMLKYTDITQNTCIQS
jgi:hypothetical protein